MKASNTVLKVVRSAQAGSLKDAVKRLARRYGASCLKLSTEDAGMCFEQIHYWARVCHDILPVVVKIGGPNARNDIRELLKLPVDGLIAPMVESPYGLENFMEALQSCATVQQFQRLKKQVNIETITAVEQLDGILQSPHARFLDEITIGCSDLSRSARTQVQDPAFISRVAEMVRIIRDRGITVSVGGGIAPGTIDAFLAQVRPDKFNTRVITISLRSGRTYREVVQEALRFEIMMLAKDLRNGYLRREEERSRVRELLKRLD